MASLTSQKAAPLLVVLLAGLVGYIAYTGAVIENLGLSGLSARKDQIVAIQDTIQRLQAATDSAKKELARGTVEDLRKRLETYRGSLALLRRLVPERNEVPNLLDDISSRGKIRGVTLSQVVPLPVEPGPAPFDTYKYNMSVIGHYDQIGAFLADVASLQRIIVPYDLTVAAANAQSAKALGDTSGSMLEAKFQVRTFVKSSSSGEGEASGT
jgi:type IV pilus assembly protein PilO